jgi:hypothetical protein
MKHVIAAAAAFVIGVSLGSVTDPVHVRAFDLGRAASEDPHRPAQAELDRLDSPAPAAPAHLLPPDYVFTLAAAYPWPAHEALKIAGCESTLYADADNGYQVGLYQIDYATHWRRVTSRADLFDPVINTRVAFDIWAEAGGWDGPWRGCIWALN